MALTLGIGPISSGCPDRNLVMSGSGPCGPIFHGVWQSSHPHDLHQIFASLNDMLWRRPAGGLPGPALQGDDADAGAGERDDGCVRTGPLRNSIHACPSYEARVLSFPKRDIGAQTPQAVRASRRRGPVRDRTVERGVRGELAIDRRRSRTWPAGTSLRPPSISRSPAFATHRGSTRQAQRTRELDLTVRRIRRFEAWKALNEGL